MESLVKVGSRSYGIELRLKNFEVGKEFQKYNNYSHLMTLRITRCFIQERKKYKLLIKFAFTMKLNKEHHPEKKIMGISWIGLI